MASAAGLGASATAFAILLATAALLPRLAVGQDRLQLFDEVHGSLCINSDFIRSFLASAIDCAALCSSDPRCRAFSTEDGPCRLFVFDKCSKSVRDCGCSRRGRLFVKRQSGLEPGALCPSDYGDDLCGVKYKMLTSTGVWAVQRQRCESDGPLSMMADVMDAVEMSHVNLLYVKYGSQGFHLGGQQLPGSEEPAGGWVWAGCNISIDSSLWYSGEPNNGGAGEDVTMRVIGRSKLADVVPTLNRRALCECVSPFA